ncbi:PKD-like family lipoprotein [Chitinophaga qingshengii]|uniref:PKD-like family protein n=1 Tax=Chitinophaga qingshengii TaxID=1569794 RepID=A0ABR7TJ59_9BACT|nr:PKD-like family lipoprotein [Chitinophaga qingshengii]MBC9930003.1 hypothetical protein [Chitinophaga qingshengii]
MRKRHYIHLWLMATFLQVACMKDKGNYQYESINRIIITGIDSSYTVSYGDRLKVNPLLSFTQEQQEDTTNYSYLWVADHVLGYSWIPDTIATTRNLDAAIRLRRFGTYYMYYRVTDKRTGVFTDAYFYVTMTTPSFEGWLLLSDVGNGDSRLSMVSHLGNRDTVYPDILKTVGTAYTPVGAPVFVETAISDFPRPGQDIYVTFVATSKQFVYLGQDTLEYSPANDMKKYVPAAVTDWSGARFSTLLTKDGLLTLNKNVYAILRNSYVGPVNNTADGKRFSASGWATFKQSISALSTCVLFDTDKGTFYRYPGNGTTCIPYTNSTLFDFNTGKDLLYLKHVPFNGGEVFAVLQDRLNNKRYLARFTLIGTQHYYSEITGDDISGATQFAVSSDLGYLFYSAGGKLYEYDPVNNRSILMKDYGTRAISLIKFQQFIFTYDGTANASRYQELAKKLIVCTYEPDAPSSSGMLDIYHVPDANAPLQLYQSFSGDIGKIVSVSYRDR